jgi:uncharacterized membrane protein
MISMIRRTATRTIQIAITAVFTSLVTAATMVFSIYVPTTQGFFNIGETMVYITALLFGPLIGAFAGGVGSMAADLLLGYPQYAPGTLVIKAVEGGIVGFLSHKKIKFGSKLRWKAFTFILGLIVGVLLGVVGSNYYSGSVELYLGIPPPEVPTTILYIPPEFWYILGAASIIAITMMGFTLEPEFGWIVLVILVGGLEMIIGYFLYEQIFLGVAAIAEIPINIGQMIVGLIASIPVMKTVQRALPSLKS